jgi:hypothetical protein
LSTAPTPVGPPNVQGNYAGTVTISFTGRGSFSCPANTTVTQNGSNVTIAPLTMGGSCPGLGVSSLPIGDGAISNTGSLGQTTINNLFLAACNGFYSATASGGFFGSSAQFSIVYTATSGGCVNNPGNFSFSGTLNKS